MGDKAENFNIGEQDEDGKKYKDLRMQSKVAGGRRRKKGELGEGAGGDEEGGGGGGEKTNDSKIYDKWLFS